MKNLFIIISILFISSIAHGQKSNELFNGYLSPITQTGQIIVNVNGVDYNAFGFTGVFNNDLGQYDGSELSTITEDVFIAVTVDGSVYELKLNSFVGGSIVQGTAIDFSNELTALPSGAAAIYVKTPNKGYPASTAGLSVELREAIDNHFKLMLDNEAGGGGGLLGFNAVNGLNDNDNLLNPTVKLGGELIENTSVYGDYDIELKSTFPVVGGNNINNRIFMNPGADTDNLRLEAYNEFGTLYTQIGLSPTGILISTPSINTLTAENGDVLKLTDATTGEVEYGKLALGDLSNVVLTDPVSADEVLKFDGTNWINGTVTSTGGGAEVLNDLTDVTIDDINLVANDLLVYDGTKWVNQQPTFATSVTASNGLTATQTNNDYNVKLGGTLTENTTIEGSGSYSMTMNQLNNFTANFTNGFAIYRDDNTEGTFAGVSMNGFSGLLNVYSNLNDATGYKDAALAVTKNSNLYLRSRHQDVASGRYDERNILMAYNNSDINIYSINQNNNDKTSLILSPTYMKVITPNVDAGTATVGQVLTLSNVDGTVEFGEGGGGGTGGIALTDLSATTAAPGTTSLVYNNTTGEFTYTPPNLSGYLTSEIDGSVTNEIQALSLSGNILSLSDGGGSVDLSALSSGDQITLTGGGITTISGTYPDFVITSTEVDGDITNEIQDLSITGNTLSLSSDPTTVDLSGYLDDQTVTLTGGGITSISGTYPNFTITSTEVDGSVNNEGLLSASTVIAGTSARITSNTGGGSNIDLTANTGIAISSSGGNNILITNSAPDQTVSITGSGFNTVTGTYPNFTIDAAAAIEDLSNVVLTTPSSGQVLKFDGTNWVNDTDNTGTVGGGVSSVNVTTGLSLASTSTPEDVVIELGGAIAKDVSITDIGARNITFDLDGSTILSSVGVQLGNATTSVITAPAYGSGNKTATALSKTESDYVLSLATDGTVTEILKSTLGGISTLSIDNNSALLTVDGLSVDLSEAIDNQVNTLFTDGTNILSTYDNISNTLTVRTTDALTQIDAITFDNNVTDAVTSRMQYNADVGTFVMGAANNVPIKAGQDVVWYVKNNTLSTIPKGTAVMAVGADGNSGIMLIDEMVFDGSVDAKYFLGVTAEEITSTSNGTVISQGTLKGFDTSLIPASTVLYGDPATPGGFTTTEPTGGNLKLPIANTLSQTNNGTIAIRVHTGLYMKDIHDVDVTTLADNNILKYDLATTSWKTAIDEVNDADADATNEIQDLSLTGNTLSLSEDATTVDLSTYLDDQTVVLTQGGIVSISGTYPNFTISATEVDGSVTNEIQDLSLTGNTLSLSGDATTVDLSTYLDDKNVVDNDLIMSGSGLIRTTTFTNNIYSIINENNRINLGYINPTTFEGSYLSLNNASKNTSIYGTNIFLDGQVLFEDYGLGDKFLNGHSYLLGVTSEGYVVEVQDENLTYISLTDLSVTENLASGGGSLSYNNTNGVFNYTPPDLSGYLTSDQTTASNGLTKVGNNIKLGGTLTESTSIITGANNLIFQDAVSPTSSFRLSPGFVEFKGLLYQYGGNVRFDDYGLGNKEASDLSLTASDYLIGTATDGTLIDVPISSISGSSGISLTDLSVTQNAASGNGALTYNNTNGVFSYTPPNLSSYLTSEVDGSITNEIQDLSLTGNTLSLSSDATTVDLSPYLDDQTVTLTGGGNTAISGTYPNFTITSTEVDGSVTNEIQTITASNGLTATATGNDYDISLGGTLSDSKVITLNANSFQLTSSNLDAGFFIDNINNALRVYGQTLLMDYGDGTNTGTLSKVLGVTSTGLIIERDPSEFTGIGLTDLSVTTNPAGTASLSYNNTNGVFTYTPPDLSSYLTSEVDGSVTNEIQDLSLTGNTLSLSSDATTVDLSNYLDDQTVTLTGGGITAISGTYPNFTITSTEVDGSVTNEIQTLSLNSDNLSLSSGGGTVSLPYLRKVLTGSTSVLIPDGGSLSFWNLNTGTTGITIDDNVNTLTYYGSNIYSSYGSGTNTGTLAYLAGFTSTGSLIEVNPYSGSNGLNLSGSNFKLGGTISENTIIALNNNSLSLGQVSTDQTYMRFQESTGDVHLRGNINLKNKDGFLYGTGYSEASDFSFIKSDYLASFSTGGNLIEVKANDVFTSYIVAGNGYAYSGGQIPLTESIIVGDQFHGIKSYVDVSGRLIIEQGAHPIISTTTSTIDFENKAQSIVKYDLTSASSTTSLTLSGAVSGGIYTMHFINAAGKTINWPSNAYDETGSEKANDTITSAGKMFTMYYDGANYYVK